MNLLDRMRGWMMLLGKREDLTFEVLRDEAGKAEPYAFYPDDAKALAKQVSRLFFSWRHREARGVDGFLNLELTGFNEPAFLVLKDGTRVNEADMLSLDVDTDGVGFASWLVAPEKGRSFIVWSVEDAVEFPTLTDYLTKGARRAFSYSGNPWQREFDAEPRLAEFSVPATTPPAQLRAGLVQRGASGELADALLEWLGADVRFLLPK
ncbi:MAG: hypothetical protein ACOZQL_28880 [Myxococcota bacterium]